MRVSAKAAMKIAAVTVAVSTLAATPAQAASVTTSSCNGKGENEILTKFVNPGADLLPLRCGNLKYGFNHIVYRKHWNSTTLAMIQTTLTNGEQKDAGAKVLFGAQCQILYTVAYGYNGYRGTGPAPVGIITAYPPDTTTAAPDAANNDAAAATAAKQLRASGYRRDCPIYLPIGD